MDDASYQSVKEEIKRSADIVDLVGNFVQLRKAGKNYVGLCPFHSEKEPSFTVNRERQMFHCFGCKKGGDIFDFWMAYHHCTFPEALKDLAERYHVPLPQRPLTAQEKRKRERIGAIFSANEAALRYFHETLLRDSVSHHAREYLKSRGIGPEITKEFLLGFAPDRWEGLVEYLERENIELGIAESAGLIILKNKRRYYDRFRKRIIFPIFDLKGRPIGFGGRVLEGSHPKYLNTPETPVFQKGKVLYGLQASYTHMRSTRRALIVEGYMDFLAMWSFGIRNSAATLGTALTASQVRRLKGYVDEIIVIFDSDEAGRKAALRGLPIFVNEGIQARAVLLPEGHDPDTFLRAEGTERFLDLVSAAPVLLEFYLEQSLSGKGQSIEQKVGVVRELLPSICELKDPMLRAAFVQKVAEDTGIRENVVWSELGKVAKGQSKQVYPQGGNSKLNSGTVRKFTRDVHLLNLLIYHPEVARELVDCRWQLLMEDENTSKVISAFFDKLKREGGFEPGQLIDELPDETAKNELRESLMQSSFYDEAGARIAVSEIKRKIDELEIISSIRQAKERGDMEELNALLKLRAKLYQGMV
ncbi:MAG: DNA primase [Deltaproteobacteria bacterium]|nr:DNA primase [Deltaproteobacteria bacterium]HDM09505.1 DNA primase [Desulfobacteraceae bacterium]